MDDVVMLAVLLRVAACVGRDTATIDSHVDEKEEQ